MINSLSSTSICNVDENGDSNDNAKFVKARKLIRLIKDFISNTAVSDAMKAQVKKESSFMELVSFFQSLEVEAVPIRLRLSSPAEVLRQILQDRPQAYFPIISWTSNENISVREGDGDEALDSVLAFRDYLRARSTPGQEFLSVLLTALGCGDVSLELNLLLLAASLEFQDSENVYRLSLEVISLNEIVISKIEPNDSDIKAMEQVLQAIEYFNSKAAMNGTNSIPLDDSFRHVRFTIDNPTTLNFLAADLKSELIASCPPHQLSQLQLSLTGVPIRDMRGDSVDEYFESLLRRIVATFDQSKQTLTSHIVTSIALPSLLAEAMVIIARKESSQAEMIVRRILGELERQLVQWRLSPAGERVDRFRHYQSNAGDDLPPPNEDMINTIVAKGFSKNGAKRSVYYSRSESVQKALAWAVEHSNDADFDFPLALKVRGALKPEIFADDSLTNLYISGDCLPEAITLLRNDILNLFTDNSERNRNALIAIPSERTEETLPLTTALATTDHVDENKPSRAKKSYSKKAPASKLKSAIRLTVEDFIDVKEFIELEASTVAESKIDISHPSRTDPPTMMTGSGQDVVNVEPIVGEDNINTNFNDDLATTDILPVECEVGPGDEANMPMEDIYPDSADTVNLVADVESPLRSLATSRSTSLQKLSPPLVPSATFETDAIEAKAQELKPSVVDVMTDSIYLSLVSGEIAASFEASDELFRVSTSAKEDYLMQLHGRSSEVDESDINSLSLEMARDIATFDSSASLEVIPLYRTLLEICLLSLSNAESQQKLKNLLKAASHTTPKFFVQFESYSLFTLRRLLQLEEFASVNVPLDWHFHLLAIKKSFTSHPTKDCLSLCKTLLDASKDVVFAFPKMYFY